MNSNTTTTVAGVIKSKRKYVFTKNRLILRCQNKSCGKELNKHNKKYCNKWCYQMAKLDINIERFKMLVIKGKGI